MQKIHLPQKEPSLHIFKMPNLPKSPKNNFFWPREKSEDYKISEDSIAIEQLLPLNDTSLIILAAPIDIFNKMET